MSKTEIFALTAQLLPLLGAGFGFIYGMIRFLKRVWRCTFKLLSAHSVV